jgi:succinate dehydrogenase/fumarate reductase cytochrome b subunit
MHNVAGFILMFWLALQILLGLAARKIQQPISVNTSTVIVTKRIHRIFSYGILLIGMFNLLNRRFVD